MENAKALKLLVFFVFQSACASLDIKTTPPQAEVLLYSSGSAKPKVLGKTPLSISLSDALEGVDGSSMTLKIKKHDFQSQSFLLPLFTLGSLTLDSSLEKISDSIQEDAEARKFTNENFKAFFKSFEYLADDDLARALSEIEKLKKNLPKISMVYLLESVVLVASGDTQNALTSLNRAKALDPDEEEIELMISRVMESME